MLQENPELKGIKTASPYNKRKIERWEKKCTDSQRSDDMKWGYELANTAFLMMHFPWKIKHILYWKHRSLQKRFVYINSIGPSKNTRIITRHLKSPSRRGEHEAYSTSLKKFIKIAILLTSLILSKSSKWWKMYNLFRRIIYFVGHTSEIARSPLTDTNH